MNKKTFSQISVSLCLLVVVLIFFVSCGPPNEKAHPAYKRGVNLMEKREYKEAAESFEKYLIFNYNSSLTHYKLAELYNDYLDDPFLAVYHFKYYLKLEPNTSDRDVILSWIESAEEKMVKRIKSRNPDFVSEEEINRLKQNNSRYRELLLKLKKQNAEFRKKLSSGTIVSFRKKDKSSSDTENVPSAKPGKFVISRVYKVKSGDSLSKISRKVYGSSKYYKLIFEANRDVLESEAKLNIGQELRIPQIKKEENNDTDISPIKDDEIPGVITD